MTTRLVVPPPCQQPTNTPKKSQPILPTSRDSALTEGLHQSSLTAYFGNSAAGLARPALAPGRRKPAAVSSGKATELRGPPVANGKAPILVESKKTRVHSPAATKPEPSS